MLVNIVIIGFGVDFMSLGFFGMVDNFVENLVENYY